MSDSSGSEAAKGLLQFLHDNFEEEFRSIAASNNIAVIKDKKMNVIQVEAMLQEVHVNRTDSCTLFVTSNNSLVVFLSLNLNILDAKPLLFKSFLQYLTFINYLTKHR